jgi:4-hydroxymandelate oxidase
VYLAGSPTHGNGSAPTCVRGAWRREFDGSSESARHPAFRAYVTDMVRPYGLSVRDDLLERGSGQSYAEMAGSLLAETVSAELPVDLLVLAFAVSDTLPGQSSASYLSHLCPGNPMAFAICDQGSAAPFTGLRLISEYARTSDCSRALLLIAEQATLHHGLPAPAVVPAKNAIVALLCTESGPGRVDAVRLHADVEPPSVPERLAADLAVLSGERDDVTVIAGGGIAAGAGGSLDAAALGIPAASQVLAAPAGQPCTGVWWRLADGLPGWTARGRRVLLADYDRLLGTLCVSAIDIQPLDPMVSH